MKSKKRSISRRHFIIIILILFIIVLIGGVLWMKKTQKEKTTAAEVEKILSFLPDQTFVTKAPSLQGDLRFKEGINVKIELKSYLHSFTSKKYSEAATKLISIQEKIGYLDLPTLLEIDAALADAISIAGKEVKSSNHFIDEQEACGRFNALLNPALLVMDLTLWSSQSKIYPLLQQNKEIGIHCLLYYPQLSMGLFTHDPRTGRIVQRSMFCDTSQPKSNCWGIWDYFWKHALDPVNYGVGCSLTDWMNQGFVCVNGIDFSDREGKLIRNRVIYSIEGKPQEIAEFNVKEEFQNALGVAGKTIIDNIKQRCAQVKDKVSPYGLAAGTSSNSLTGGVVDVSTTTDIENADLQQWYENAMLTATLFTEACALDQDSLAKDLSGGGGAGGFGLNKPKTCLLTSATSQLGSTSAGRFRNCVSNFAQQLAAARKNKIVNYNGLPDNWCKPSAEEGGSGTKGNSCQSNEECVNRCESGQCTGGKAAEGECGSVGTSGNKCGEKLSPEQEENIQKNMIDAENRGQIPPGSAEGIQFLVVPDNQIEEVCGNPLSAICFSKKEGIIYIRESDANKDNPNDAVEDVNYACGDELTTEEVCEYTIGTLIGHELYHTQGYGESATQDNDRKKGNFICLDIGLCNGYGKPVRSSTYLTPDSPSEPWERPEPGDCSSQAERALQQFEAAANCLNQQAFPENSNQPQPDPFPPGDEVGGRAVPECGEAQGTGTGGGYFGVLKGATDCMNDDVCNVITISGVPTGAITNQKCKQVEGADEGLQCPFK